MIRTAILAGGLASLLAALAPTFELLVVARTLGGFFFAAVVPTAITYIGDTVNAARRQHALAIVMAFSTSGLAAAAVLGGVAAEFVSWRAAFVATAILAGGVALLTWALPEPAHDRGAASLGQRLRALGRQGWVRVVLALAFLEGAVIFGSLTFVAASLQQDGVSATLAGSAVAAFGLANVVFTPAVTRAIARLPSPLLVGGGSALSAAGLTVAAVETSVPTAVAATLALGAGFGFLHSTMQMWATQVYPEARAVAVALFASAVFVGGAIASAAAAPLADHGRFGLIFALDAGGAALLAVLGATLRARYVTAARPPAVAGEPGAA